MTLSGEIERAVIADWYEEQGDDREAKLIRQCPWVIGATYYFRLATYAWCGTVRAVGEQEIILQPAAYVADSGRFMNAIKDGLTDLEESEIEPVVMAIVGRGALVDCVPYPHPVPTAQK